MEVSPLKDLPINKALTIDFNWECNIPTRTIRDTVMISFEEDSENPTEEDLNEVIDVERTADFEQPAQSTEKPILTFFLPADEPFYFGRIYVVCDCKIIEVFGDHGTYVNTVHGTVVDECDNFRACEFKTDLGSKIYKKVIVNFLKLNSVKNRLWIYGIHITLKPMTQKNMTASIRYDNVEELLKNAQLSDKASRCFKFLKESMNNPQFISERMSAASSTTFAHMEGPNQEKLVSELKLYVDHKFQVLTEFLILRERNLHDKVDLILDYIRNQKK